MNWVIPGILLVGDQNAGSNLSQLKKLNVGGIIVAKKSAPCREEHYYKRGLTVLHIPVNDHEQENIGMFFPLARWFIESMKHHGKATLIHCRAGKSRSVSLVVSYVMRYYNLSDKAAIKYVKQFRQCESINNGFKQQLYHYGELLKKMDKNYNPT